jgi:hypothetical protein
MDDNVKRHLLDLIKDGGKCIREGHNCAICLVIKLCNESLDRKGSAYYKDIFEESVKYYVALYCEAEDKEGILAEFKMDLVEVLL